MASRLLNIAVISSVNIPDMIEPREITDKHNNKQSYYQPNILLRGERATEKYKTRQIDSSRINRCVKQIRHYNLRCQR